MPENPQQGKQDPSDDLYQQFTTSPDRWRNLDDNEKVAHAQILTFAYHAGDRKPEGATVTVLALSWTNPACRPAILDLEPEFTSKQKRAAFIRLMTGRYKALRLLHKYLPDVDSDGYAVVSGTDFDYMGDVLADVVAVKPNWLLPPWLRRGKLHSLEGKKGVGKSQLSIYLAGRIMQDNEAGKVLFFTTEDDAAEDVKPRAMAAGVDMSRIVVYRQQITFADTDKLTAIIQKHGAVLAVFDTLQRYIPNSRADMKDAHAAQGQLTPLEGVARDTNCAMLLIRHGRKGKVEDAVEAGIGSQGIAGAMRSILVAGKHPRNEGEYALSLAVGNYASAGGSLAYQLQVTNVQVSDGMAKTCRVDVLREEHDLDADEITAGPTSSHGNDQGAQSEAREFLENILADGEMLRADILEAAKAESISKTTLYRVKAEMGVDDERREEPGKARQYWPKIWRLPKNTRHEKSGNSGNSEVQHDGTPLQHWTSQTSQTSQGSRTLETRPPLETPQADAQLCFHINKRRIGDGIRETWVCLDCGKVRGGGHSPWQLCEHDAELVDTVDEAAIFQDDPEGTGKTDPIPVYMCRKCGATKYGASDWQRVFMNADGVHVANYADAAIG